MASDDTRNLEVLGLAWSLGWRIAAGFLVGYWLDGRLDTAPWLTLTVSLAALAAGVFQIIRVTSPRDGEEPQGPSGSGADREP